jgi:SAM-dependent methyltransferase
VEDRGHLRDVQYRDDSNFNARVELHRRFSTNPGSFHRWVFDHLDLPAAARVLEVGCGPGYLWWTNADRVPPGWSAVLTDFSPGMLAVARRRLGGRYAFAVADAGALPHPKAAFDAVVANHMLYHVPDRPRTVRELARVLKPGGALYATTNGRDHLRELDDLVARQLPGRVLSAHAVRFGLENGADQLRAGFAEVEVRRWANALEITETEPVVAYLRSGVAGARVDADVLRRDVADAMGCGGGVLRVRAATGLFVARRPVQAG